jgi:hypothetical protein
MRTVHRWLILSILASQPWSFQMTIMDYLWLVLPVSTLLCFLAFLAETGCE